MGGSHQRTHHQIFLSTPSARRATLVRFNVPRGSVISIHALREEGDDKTPITKNFTRNISIHALREEGDPSVT